MDSVYLEHDDGHLVEMLPQPFATEFRLQNLLKKHPHLLVGGGVESPGWLLIQQEQGVPDREDGADRWSLDHLFVDSDGIPVLIEVKRSTDTRIRREVVGQMLDYAANGVRYWPEGSLRTKFEATAGGSDRAAAMLANFLGDQDAEEFWSKVEDNLRSGTLRLVFVADHIPDTLRRIIEFLNEQMDHTEVIGVEVRQFTGEGKTTLVPNVLGRTTAAQRKAKSRKARGTYSEDLETADLAVQQADELLTSWAHRASVQIRETRRARQFLTSEGDFLFQFYPMWETLEIPINRLREVGMDETAETIRESVQTLTSKPLSQKHLNLVASDLVEHWDQFENDVLPLLIDSANRVRELRSANDPAPTI